MDKNLTETLIPIDTGRKQPYMLEITRQPLTLRGLPPELEGKTFVHLSDMHGGFANTEPVFEQAITIVNELQPEYIFFTGDFIDDHAKNVFPIDAYLRRFQARRGKFGCFGNHEHRRGVVGSRKIIEQGEIRLLNNENVCLDGGLRLVVVDELFEGKPDIPRAFSGVSNDETSLVLSHHPRLIERVPERDCVILSGHTHGGQIALPILTPKIVCLLHLHCRQVAGWYENGRARLYVNRGLGVTGRPFRRNCPAEIAIFTLQRSS